MSSRFASWRSSLTLSLNRRQKKQAEAAAVIEAARATTRTTTATLATATAEISATSPTTSKTTATTTETTATEESSSSSSESATKASPKVEEEAGESSKTESGKESPKTIPTTPLGPKCVEIVVGTTTTSTYRLNKDVISPKSKYFEAALKLHFSEGLSSKITLPEIEPAQFDLIIMFIYYGDFDLTTLKYDRNLVIGVYHAAEYLQMKALKVKILKEVAKFLEWELRLNYANRSEQDPFILLAEFCRTAELSDWLLLRACVKPAVHSVYILPSELVEMVREEGEEASGTKILLAMIVEVYQEILDFAFCWDCQRTLGRDTKATCRKCNQMASRRAIVVEEKDLKT